MVSRAYTVAFEGVEARLIEVQCALVPGPPVFHIVGLPDKAVSEARERIRSALQALSIALPPKRITVNLSPADLPKEGNHFDLPIALALLSAIGLLPTDAVERCIAMGELALDARLLPVSGTLPAAITAASEQLALVCPAANGAEAAWVGATAVYGAGSLLEVLKHFTGQTPLPVATPGAMRDEEPVGDLLEVRGQERAKRALEIAAAGRHNLLLVGPPGSGKSMLAHRLPGLLPPLSAEEALETAMIHSLAGTSEGGMRRQRPFRAPHHTASARAMTGGGRRARPGEFSLAHNGVLFLDELPEFAGDALESLREPLETGEIRLARVSAHLRYPCRFQLIAAANPCRCGHLSDAARACPRAPGCGADYMARISGPLMDRFDLRLEVPPVAFTDLDQPARGESSRVVAARVAAARAVQAARFPKAATPHTNADLQGEALDRFAAPDAEGRALLSRLAERMNLTARGYHRVLRVARTIADLAGSDAVRKAHLAEAFSYRLTIRPQAR